MICVCVDLYNLITIREMLYTLKCTFLDVIMINLKSNGDFYYHVRRCTFENIKSESVCSIYDHTNKSTCHELDP
jgi:hypothetical protein